MYYYHHYPPAPPMPPPIPSTTHPLYKTPLSPPSSTSSSPKSSPNASPVSSPNQNTSLKRKRQPKKNLHAPDYGFSVNFPIVPINVAVPNEQMSLIPSPSNISMKKYSTAVDSRKFLTVYEFMVNNQWIIWDYHTGYVHLTGLWKAIGNNKADIVKLIENSPELEPDIKRVRGGYLKIQGTWVPFKIAKALAARTCYLIRYALIPLFGNDFPDSCLKPNEPGFGQLQMRLTDPVTKRRRRKRLSSQQQHQQQQFHEPIPLQHPHPQQPIPMPMPMQMPMQHPHQQPIYPIPLMHQQPMPIQYQPIPMPLPHAHTQFMAKHPEHLPSPPHVAHHIYRNQGRPAKRTCLNPSYTPSSTNLPPPALTPSIHTDINPTIPTTTPTNTDEIHLPSIKTLENNSCSESKELPPILPPIINSTAVAKKDGGALPFEVLEATRSLQQLSAGVGLGISGVPLASPCSVHTSLKSNWSLDSQENSRQTENNLRSTSPSPFVNSKNNNNENAHVDTRIKNMDSEESTTLEQEMHSTPAQHSPLSTTVEKTRRVMDIHGLLS